MKSLLIRSLLSLSLTAAGSATLLAQSGTTTRFIIPFDFTAGKVTIPAGDYTVQPVANNGILSFQRADGHYVGMVLVRNPSGNSNQPHGTATFHRYGNRYFLSEITNSAGGGWQLSQSKEEQVLAKSAPAAPVTLATARSK